MNSAIHQLDAAGDVLRLVQITDTHLLCQPGGTLLGLDTDHSLQQVIDLVLNQRSDMDLVLATGDISDRGSEAAYLRARDYFARLPAETVWLAGNHDRQDLMQKVLGQEGCLVRALQAGHWQLVLLNSQIPGEAEGQIGQEELDWLESCLEDAASKQLYTLICLHHQPVAMGSAWIDQQQVTDCDAFFALVDRFPLVRGILWGHVHQQHDSERKGVRLMSTPSSCFQFVPHNDDFKVDDKAPGYRWLELQADGGIETAVCRVEGVEFKVDLESRGYR
ncbi:MAG: 3',5'-cyclic-AMP phosphodiesterase [Gammaproteobacteria bacterium]|nr:3',5'-cyclic-AMP phosphodiesterase [Gammaproteobacteria bacterium]